MDELILAEDLLLLLLDDEKGTLSAGGNMTPLLGGAMLAGLRDDGLVELEAKTSLLRSAKVRALPCDGHLDPLSRQTLDHVGAKQRSPQALVGRLGKGLADELLTRLARQGLIERRDGRWLGFIPHTTWPAEDLDYERGLRRQLRAILVDGHSPTQRMRSLISLLSVVGQAHKVVEGDRRQLAARAKAMSKGDWVAVAVKHAIDSAAAAAVGASTAAAAASVS